MTPGEMACAELKVSLRDYFEARLASITEQMESRDKMVDERLKSVSDQIKKTLDDRGRFVVRELHDKLQDQLSRLETVSEALRSRMMTWFGAMTLFNTVILGLFIYHFSK